jgi:hypothetical protein
MGKAAENERIKLGATWYNNLSVALTFTGVLIPVLSLYKAENFQLLGDWLSLRSLPTSLQGTQLVLSVVAVCGAFWAAATLHNSALKEVAKLQD